MTISSYLTPLTTSTDMLVHRHRHHHACNGSVGFSVRNADKMLPYCNNNAKLGRPNGFPISTVGSSSTATEENIMLTKNKDDIGVLDLVTANNVSNVSTNKISIEAEIGIARFLKGKSFFITGATGFLAKVLIEKILRTTPDVSRIYVLIKAKSKEAAVDRWKNEIINTELFRTLREIHGSDFVDMMLGKMVPVPGDATEAQLGIDAAMAEEISQEVDVIVNSAANTTFDERYDVALDINTMGAFRLMNFAKRFKRLKLFLQVSTAYVNGTRTGKILEKPFCIGDSIAKELASSEPSGDSVPLLDVEAEIRLAFSSRNARNDGAAAQEMKNLGLKRAKMYGWQDTYVFTKAMAEMVIDSMRGDIPLVVIRPSVIESTWKEPFPGWVEGNRMMDPIILYYGKGQLTGFLADPKGVLDVVPADMVVNAMLAAMAKHALKKQAGIYIYQVASSIVNPLGFQELADLTYQHFKLLPCIDSRGHPIDVPKLELFNDISTFSGHVHSSSMLRMSAHEKMSQKLNNVCMKLVEQARYLANIYEPYTFYNGRFDNTNTQKLMVEMSIEEWNEFYFDVGGIHWKEYISNVHIPGLRRHVMKGRGMCANISQLVHAKV